MQELAKIDKEKFQDTYADLKYFEGKTGRRPNANERREVTFELLLTLMRSQWSQCSLIFLVTSPELLITSIIPCGTFFPVSSSKPVIRKVVQVGPQVSTGDSMGSMGLRWELQKWGCTILNFEIVKLIKQIIFH